jgi:hypothetical protein
MQSDYDGMTVNEKRKFLGRRGTSPKPPKPCVPQALPVWIKAIIIIKCINTDFYCAASAASAATPPALCDKSRLCWCSA